MSEMTGQIGKALVVLGTVLLCFGLLILFGTRFSFFGLGRLPGDIAYKGKNFGFYFPVVTCLVLSAIVTLVLWLISHLGRR